MKVESRGKRRILLISNTVMHYRVAVYNYFHRRFADEGWEWRVLTDEIQPENRISPQFPLDEESFGFFEYRRRILEINPDVVILFLHLKDKILWPLVHWLKATGRPFACWTKTRNLDDPHNRLKNAMFDYVHGLSGALILYSADLIRYLPERHKSKVFVANNTINHEEFPEISEGRDEIKKSLGIPFNKVVLFVGRMDVDGGRKRVDHLIEIFRDTGGRNAGLVIVGPGMKASWRARMDPSTTIYLGEIHDPENKQIARIFKMADIAAIPGHVGLGLNQALFYGLPVVTMEGNQPPEIAYLHPGQNGFIVPRGDVQQLREKIFHLLDDDIAREHFSVAARDGFLKEASIEQMFQGFLACAEFLCSGAANRRK
jgi:glycosyltransferase involved in cell wall biosynthesis